MKQATDWTRPENVSTPARFSALFTPGIARDRPAARRAGVPDLDGRPGVRRLPRFGREAEITRQPGFRFLARRFDFDPMDDGSPQQVTGLPRLAPVR